MAKNVADLVTEVLHRAGVKRIYGVVGDSLNAITESLRQRRDHLKSPFQARTL